MSNKLYAFADRPIETEDQDWLDIQKYSKAVSRYIRECNTPMTIALQGDWGSGKTSMMNMIRQNLTSTSGNQEGEVYTAWFNTWQFSQFHAKDELPINFLLCLVNEIQKIGSMDGEARQDTQKEKILRIINSLKKNSSWILFKLLTKHVIPEELHEELEKVIDDGEVNPEKQESIADIISTLKDELQGWINKKIERNQDTSRIVIFVDDLDRLEPVKAVELLEILKLFMDLENCVYVLAIDYDVVVRGVKDKYGQDFSEEKGRAFFEKIIQLPFKMPVLNYNLENYVKEMLKGMDISLTDNQKIETIYKFIKDTVGTNPRAMKRLFNMFSLLRIVGIEDKDTNSTGFTPEQSVCMLALLCLQIGAEKLYHCLFIITAYFGQDDLMTLLSSTYEELTKDDTEEGYEELFEECEIDQEFWDCNHNLLEDFFKLIDASYAQNPKNNLTEKTYTMLKNVLSASTMTTNGNVEGRFKEKVGSGRAARRVNTEIQTHTETFNMGATIADIRSKNERIGLDGCKFIGFQFEGKDRQEVKNGNDFLQKVLSELYKQDPEKFEREVIHQTQIDSLRNFFDEKEIKAKGNITKPNGETIAIELKNSSARKIELIQKMMDLLKLERTKLQYEVRLKQYIKRR